MEPTLPERCEFRPAMYIESPLVRSERALTPAATSIKEDGAQGPFACAGLAGFRSLRDIL